MKRTPLCLGFAAVFLLLAMGCSHRENGRQPLRKTASATVQPPLEQGEQWDASNEDEANKIIDINTQLLDGRTKNESFVYRDAHPKLHGCPTAFFDVDSGALAPESRVGVFASAAGTKFSAWVRFSNGDPDGEHSPDSKADIRGMAIKLMNVAGTEYGSQDLVMLTAKEFFSTGADDYMDLHNALSSGSLATIWYMAFHGTQRGILEGAEIQAANPLQVEYFSSVPYKLGNRSMKFKARPCAGGPQDTVPDGNADPNYLRARLVASLKAKPACYEFLVEPNMDPTSNPIENPTIAWNETVSPYTKVATVTFPQQEAIDSQEHLNFCENLTFNPWHTLPETRPMGQINRMRRLIYPAMTDYRHVVNHIQIIEPKSHEICTGETAPLCQAPKR